MGKRSRIVRLGVLLVAGILPGAYAVSEIRLPKPETRGTISLEEALTKRKSDRDYTSSPLALADVSQLLWAAQGVTRPGGLRTAPSAGATYPLETYMVVGSAAGLAPGIYHYSPAGHTLALKVGGDKRSDLAGAALGQDFVREAAIVVAFAAVPERTTARYGAERGLRYVHMEAGHAAQNVQLQGTSLGLGSVVVGAFNDRQVKSVLSLPANEQPLYLIPVGYVPGMAAR